MENDGKIDLWEVRSWYRDDDLMEDDWAMREEEERYIMLYPLYTLYAPFIHLHYHMYTYVHPLYMYIRHIHTLTRL